MHAKRKVDSVLASELMFGGRHFFPNFIISSLGLTMVRAVCLAEIKQAILCRSSLCIVRGPTHRHLLGCTKSRSAEKSGCNSLQVKHGEERWVLDA